MANFRREGPPLVQDVNAFNDDYRDVRENIVVKSPQGQVEAEDAGSTYTNDVRDLINELKAKVNSMAEQLTG
jgi:hypothetical protein